MQVNVVQLTGVDGQWQVAQTLGGVPFVGPQGFEQLGACVQRQCRQQGGGAVAVSGLRPGVFDAQPIACDLVGLKHPTVLIEHQGGLRQLLKQQLVAAAGQFGLELGLAQLFVLNFQLNLVRAQLFNEPVGVLGFNGTGGTGRAVWAGLQPGLGLLAQRFAGCAFGWRLVWACHGGAGVGVEWVLQAH